MTFLAKWAVKLGGSASSRRFDKAASDVRNSQSEKLRWIMEHNAGTEYGRRFGFGSVRTESDYRERVPVISYDDIKDEVGRMARGEDNVLTADKPVMFARTSGTTGEPKLIPVTRHCRGRDHADQMRTWLYRAQADHEDLLRGKVVSLVSPAVEGRTESGIPYGSTSGAIYRDLPAPIRSTYAIPYEVFALDDYFAKYYLVLRLGIAENVTFLCTANPSSIVKLAEIGDEESEALLRDIRDGTIRDDLDLPEDLRKRLTGRLRADPDHAREIESHRSRRDGRFLPADYWPDICLIGCWKGGTVGGHLERFGDWFDPDGTRGLPVRDWGYLSSEARGSIPVTDEGRGGVLTVATNYYEFVPVEDLEAAPEDQSRWQFLSAWETEEPRDYYVFVTTTGGLYRYDMNDIVRVTGHYHDAPVIEFVRKGRGMTSLTGEKVSVEQVQEAVQRAARELDVPVAHFRAEAQADRSLYVFKTELEPDATLDGDRARRLLSAIESALADLNEEYRSKRKSMRLGDPELWLMKEGWHDQEKRNQGQRVFQSKSVLLVPTDGSETSELDGRMCSRRVALEPSQDSVT